MAAYWLGFKDGFSQPYELTLGRTWDADQGRNEAYDIGANLGQIIGAIARLHPMWAQPLN